MTNDNPVLVVGGTGMLGGQVLTTPGVEGSASTSFQTGRYVADPTRQREVFGEVPTAEGAIARLVQRLGHTIPV